MRLDIRMPIGLMFSIFGGLLLVFGIVTEGDAIYERSLGINVNASWGAVLLAFGAAMLWLGRAHPAPPPVSDAPPEGPPPS